MTVSIAKGSTGDRVYTAHFTPKYYSIIYNTAGEGENGGNTGVAWTKTNVLWTDKVLNGIENPTREGWIFTGWKCGDVTVTSDASYSDLASDDAVASVTLVAQWEPEEPEEPEGPEGPEEPEGPEGPEGGERPPEMIAGMGQRTPEGEKKALSFTSDAPYSEFIRVEIDGATLEEKHYSVKEGSTVVTLKADYVATLTAGEHTIGIVSAGGTAQTRFTVVLDLEEGQNPECGDNSMPWLWSALLVTAGALAAGTVFCAKRKSVCKNEK